MRATVWQSGCATKGMTLLRPVSLVPIRAIRHYLERAAAGGRILVTIDTDFGELVYVRKVPHAGLVRLPDVPTERRIALIAEVLDRYRQALEVQAIVTVRDGRIRISHPPSP